MFPTDWLHNGEFVLFTCLGKPFVSLFIKGELLGDHLCCKAKVLVTEFVAFSPRNGTFLRLFKEPWLSPGIPFLVEKLEARLHLEESLWERSFLLPVSSNAELDPKFCCPKLQESLNAAWCRNVEELQLFWAAGVLIECDKLALFSDRILDAVI